MVHILPHAGAAYPKSKKKGLYKCTYTFSLEIYEHKFVEFCGGPEGQNATFHKPLQKNSQNVIQSPNMTKLSTFNVLAFMSTIRSWKHLHVPSSVLKEIPLALSAISIQFVRYANVDSSPGEYSRTV